MGATDRSIMSHFHAAGAADRTVGTIIGVTGGYLLCYVLNTYEIIKLPADVYYLSHLAGEDQIQRISWRCLFLRCYQFFCDGLSCMAGGKAGSGGTSEV